MFNASQSIDQSVTSGPVMLFHCTKLNLSPRQPNSDQISILLLRRPWPNNKIIPLSKLFSVEDLENGSQRDMTV